MDVKGFQQKLHFWNREASYINALYSESIPNSLETYQSFRDAVAAHLDTPSPERQTGRQAGKRRWWPGSHSAATVMNIFRPPSNGEQSDITKQPIILDRRNHQHDTQHGSNLLCIESFIRMPRCTVESGRNRKCGEIPDSLAPTLRVLALHCNNT